MKAGTTTVRQGGFTIIELMITVVLLAILASLAAPSFTSMIVTTRISGQVNDLVGSINLARSEAVKRNNGVTICQSSDGSTCGGETGWSTGWIVFSDPDVDAAVASPTDIVRVFPAMSSNTTAVFDGSASSITFIGLGRPLGTFTGTFVKICPPQGGDYCRYICINSQGRPRVDTPAQYAADTICGAGSGVGGVEH
jgi:type IV fimbrial biogenesis protein FimT